jgi:hypothetical protein
MKSNKTFHFNFKSAPRLLSSRFQKATRLEAAINKLYWHKELELWPKQRAYVIVEEAANYFLGSFLPDIDDIVCRVDSIPRIVESLSDGGEVERMRGKEKKELIANPGAQEAQ